MILKKLNDNGIAILSEFLSDLRDENDTEPPYYLLNDETTSEDVSIKVDIEKREFQNKLDLAEYLDNFIPLLSDLEKWDSNIWSWLSLFLFEQICPKLKDGKRKAPQDYRIILSNDFRHRYRHLLANPYSIYNQFKNTGNVLLYSPVNVITDFNEQIQSRIDIVSNSGILEAIDTLYFDNSSKKPKIGVLARDDKPGVLRRFIPILQQFDLTYDLQGMTSNQILSMLPSEFDKWKAAE